MTALVLRADARALPIASGTVDLIVTSPPYWALRAYEDDGQRYDGQIGAEPTPGDYVDNLVAATAEWLRVLRPTGSLFVNLGDKWNTYAANRGEGRRSIQRADGRGTPVHEPGRGLDAGAIPYKSLIGLPWRYALAVVDRLGAILRAELIWSKPNGLPESVTDRVRRSHETWFHFTRQRSYYSATDEIRETPVRTGRRGTSSAYDAGVVPGRPGHNGLADRANHPLGSLPGSVWEIATEPLIVPEELGVEHYAAFPIEWPRRLVLGWSPRDVCLACELGRRPVAAVDRDHVDQARATRKAARTVARTGGVIGGGTAASTLGHQTTRRIVGYACGCTPYTDHRGQPVERSDDRTTGLAPRTSRGQLGSAPTSGAWREYHFDGWQPAGTRPGVVLDPFGGTGTVALVAEALGRRGISADLSADYGRLATWRTTDRGELARAMRVPKPEPVADGQLALELGV